MVKITSFEGMKALITGGSSGIGLSCARALSREGAVPLLAARSESRSEKAVKSIPGRSFSYVMDVTDLDDILRVKERISTEHEHLDILINSAGIVHPGRLEDLTFEQISSTIDVDLKGMINTTKAMLPLMRSPGYVVNISSMAGFLGIYGYSAYSAAKFGVWGFSQSLRMELEPGGIGVAVVFPPDTDTPQLEFENRTRPRELSEISGTIRPISAGKVAGSVVKAMKKGEHMVFPDVGSRSTFMASSLAGPVVRRWMDRKVDTARRSGGGKR